MGRLRRNLSEVVTGQGILLMTGSLIVLKILYELGHAITARHGGCRVSTIGVDSFGWPVLYTDVTDAEAEPAQPLLAIAAPVR